MKRLIKKWLGLYDLLSAMESLSNQQDFDRARISALEKKEDVPFFSESGVVMVGGVRSVLYALLKHLKLRPVKDWINDESALPPEHPKIQVIKMEKARPPQTRPRARRAI